MTFRRCKQGSAEFKALRAEGFRVVAINTNGIALLMEDFDA